MDLNGGVVYQIYPRSFQDSDGDGVGDLAGIRARLDHLQWLGVDAIWMSPIYPSPLADFGYDVADYTAIDPVFGDLDEYDRLLEAAHERGIGVLMDIVPCHTSTEHRWFRDHPDWYVWADRPNNWVSAFGGSAWSKLGDRWYLHSFYPEQADLDWRNPEVIAAMQDVFRFWLERGADGYRIDAIDRLLKDPLLRDDPPATQPFGLPMLTEGEAALALTNSRNAPDIGAALAQIRTACGEAHLIGEVFLPAARWAPYLEYFDSVFAFELLHSPWDAVALRTAIEASTRRPGAAWVMSNHDFGRLATRYGERNARAAAMLLLTLPGPAFLFQGDEIGQGEGAPGVRFDRAGRDRHRHPMQWDASGGFTTGEPWLPLVDPGERNVADQRDDSASMLTLVRELIALRRELDGELELIDAAEGVLAFRRGDHVVAVNTTAEARPAPLRGAPRLATMAGALDDGMLAAHAAAIGLG